MNGVHRGIGMTSQRTRERLIARLKEEGIRDLKVLDRIRNTPRHLFVDEALASRAYEDTALPIGRGQTISQPWVVAKMTEALLEGGPLESVLEVGTGSGYQTAVLAPLVAGTLGETVGWSELVDQVTAAGCLTLLITGGEPFLRRDIGEIYRMAQDHTPVRIIYVTTNGLLLNPEKSAALLTAGLSNIMFSVDGF